VDKKNKKMSTNTENSSNNSIYELMTKTGEKEKFFFKKLNKN
jgi:hypothetical protein